MLLFWITPVCLCGILLSRSLAVTTTGWSGIALRAVILARPLVFSCLTSRLPPAFTQVTQSLKLTSPTLIPVLVIFFSLGAVRYQLAQPRIEPEFITFYNNQPSGYFVDGVIV